MGYPLEQVWYVNYMHVHGALLWNGVVGPLAKYEEQFHISDIFPPSAVSTPTAERSGLRFSKYEFSASVTILFVKTFHPCPEKTPHQCINVISLAHLNRPARLFRQSSFFLPKPKTRVSTPSFHTPPTPSHHTRPPLPAPFQASRTVEPKRYKHTVSTTHPSAPLSDDRQRLDSCRQPRDHHAFRMCTTNMSDTRT